MKKLFALLIAAGCLISYNAMAEERKNNMTDFKSAPQERIVEKYSYYKAEVPEEEKFPMEDEIIEEYTSSEVKNVIAEAEENIAEVQEEVKVNIAETQDKAEGTAEEVSAKIDLPMDSKKE